MWNEPWMHEAHSRLMALPEFSLARELIAEESRNCPQPMRSCGWPPHPPEDMPARIRRRLLPHRRAREDRNFLRGFGDGLPVSSGIMCGSLGKVVRSVNFRLNEPLHSSQAAFHFAASARFDLVEREKTMRWRKGLCSQTLPLPTLYFARFTRHHSTL